MCQVRRHAPESRSPRVVVVFLTVVAPTARPGRSVPFLWEHTWGTTECAAPLPAQCPWVRAARPMVRVRSRQNPIARGTGASVRAAVRACARCPPVLAAWQMAHARCCPTTIASASGSARKCRALQSRVSNRRGPVASAAPPVSRCWRPIASTRTDTSQVLWFHVSPIHPLERAAAQAASVS